MNYLKHALAVSAVSFFATGASAATYTFNLESTSYGGDPTSSSSANSFSITHGDMIGTFTGRYIENPTYDVSDKLIGDDSIDALSLDRWRFGAGIYNTTGDRQHTVDGVGYHDFVEMAFEFMGSAVDVTLSSLSFGYIATGYSNTNSAF